MFPLEQMLSPVINKRSNVFLEDNLKNVSISESLLIERIKKQKIDVLTNKIKPFEADVVRQEVVQSWIRSYNYNLDPFGTNLGYYLKENAFQEVLHVYENLIKFADGHINYLQDMFIGTNCYAILADQDGVICRVYASKFDKQVEKLLMMPGSLWNEETVGTCSHVLCALSQRPIQLCGPEHYSELSLPIVASSAPIFDIQGNLSATITIASLDSRYQNAHTLGMAVSIAKGIQIELFLEERKEARYLTAIDSDDGVITINCQGFITKANIAAIKIFGIPLLGAKFNEILGDQPLIRSVLETGKFIQDTEVEVPLRNMKLHIRAIHPVLDKVGRTMGCFFTFQKAGSSRKTTRLTPTVKNGFTFDEIVGSSPPISKLISKARKFAVLDTNILIQGESGVGKEVFAQAIHNESRPNGPFMAVNCAAIPRNLIESELFGYEGGAFTGAERRGMAGKIESAAGGTLFLDEIGDMPLELQAVLLRVLEEKKIMRVGSNRYVSVDFNLVTATNKDLFTLVQQKLFREDLYYRLAAFKITIPPLRERGNDIIKLAKYFICRTAEKQNIPIPVLGKDAETALILYAWPGNVRQLQNAMFYAASMANNSVIELEDLPDEMQMPDVILARSSQDDDRITTRNNKASESDFLLADMEKITIIQALQKTDFNIAEASVLLGFCKSTLYRKIKRYGIIVKPSNNQLAD